MRRSPPIRRWNPKIGIALVSLLLVPAACSEPAGTPNPSTSSSPLIPSPSAALVAGGTWSASGPGTVTLNNNGSTGEPSMSYAIHSFSGTWSVTSTAKQAGAVQVNYHYKGFHSWCDATVFIKAVLTRNGSTTTKLLAYHADHCDYEYPSGGFDETGSFTFDLQPGDVFGFVFGGSNDDSAETLNGTFTIVQPDNTPPSITPNVTGTLGKNGWYTSDVSLTWTVKDPQSAVTSAPCDPESVTTDTPEPGVSFTCTATSAGGTTSKSVTIERDATPPTITFSGNEDSYTVDQTVSITCSAKDATSGIASSTCPGAAGDAYTFGVGTQTLNASATDNAGNQSSAEAQFTVSVTPGSLCSLTQRWVTKAGVAHSMCKQLANGAYGAYAHHVKAQRNKSVSAEHADILIGLAGDL